MVQNHIIRFNGRNRRRDKFNGKRTNKRAVEATSP